MRVRCSCPLLCNTLLLLSHTEKAKCNTLLIAFHKKPLSRPQLAFMRTHSRHPLEQTICTGFYSDNHFQEDFKLHCSRSRLLAPRCAAADSSTIQPHRPKQASQDAFHHLPPLLGHPPQLPYPRWFRPTTLRPCHLGERCRGKRTLMPNSCVLIWFPSANDHLHEHGLPRARSSCASDYCYGRRRLG